MNKHKFSKARLDKVVPSIKRTRGLIGFGPAYKGMTAEARKADRKRRKFGDKRHG